MTLYEFKCDYCGKKLSRFIDASSLNRTRLLCPLCARMMRRLYSKPHVKVSFRAGHDPYTGQDFDSQGQRERYMAENGIMKE